jgi:hypothetical protein
MNEPTALAPATWTPNDADATAIVRARYRLRRGRRVDLAIGGVLVVIGVTFAVGGAVVVGLIDAAIGLLFVLRVHLVLAARVQRRLFALAPDELTLTWSPHELVVATPTYTTANSWSRFSRVLELEGYVFLLAGPISRGYVVYAVPRRAFPDPRQWEAFFSDASAGLAAARRSDA